MDHSLLKCSSVNCWSLFAYFVPPISPSSDEIGIVYLHFLLTKVQKICFSLETKLHTSSLFQNVMPFVPSRSAVAYWSVVFLFLSLMTGVREVKLYSVWVTVTNWKAYLASGDAAWWNFIDLCDTTSKVMQISNMCNTIGHLPSGVNYTIKMSAKCSDSGHVWLEHLHDCAAKSW